MTDEDSGVSDWAHVQCYHGSIDGERKQALLKKTNGQRLEQMRLEADNRHKGVEG